MRHDVQLTFGSSTGKWLLDRGPGGSLWFRIRLSTDPDPESWSGSFWSRRSSTSSTDRVWNEWGSISCRWRHWSRIIACWVFYLWRKSFLVSKLQLFVTYYVLKNVTVENICVRFVTPRLQTRLRRLSILRTDYLRLRLLYYECNYIDYDIR